MDLALQARVAGRVDDPHAAVAQFGADGVRAEGGAWDEGHVLSESRWIIPARQSSAPRDDGRDGTGTVPELSLNCPHQDLTPRILTHSS